MDCSNIGRDELFKDMHLFYYAVLLLQLLPFKLLPLLSLLLLLLQDNIEHDAFLSVWRN